MLDLKKFSEINQQRAVEGFKTYKNVPLTYWTTALMGEGGELCNMIKKLERVKNGGIDGGSSYTAASITKEMIEEEIGGIAIYLDLLSGLLGIDLEDAIINTFNSKSEKYGFKEYTNKIYRIYKDDDESMSFTILGAIQMDVSKDEYEKWSGSKEIINF